MRAFTTGWHHDVQTTSNWLIAQVLDMLVELAYYSKPVQHLQVLSPISLQISS